MMMVEHAQVVETVSGGVDRIGFSKRGLEGVFERIPTKGEVGELIVFQGECRLIPALRSTFQPRHGIGDFYLVIIKVVRSGAKYEFALGNESAELRGVVAVVRVGIAGLDPGSRKGIFITVAIATKSSVTTLGWHGWRNILCLKLLRHEVDHCRHGSLNLRVDRR